MKHFFFFFFFFLTTMVLSDDSFDLEEDLLLSLNEVSEIATKSKLNIDDSPSFVTVLHGDKLLKLGIDDIFGALGLVPGVQLKKEATGVPVVVFRGLSQKGEVKLMMDGVVINNTYRGSIYHFLDFPIELVERIEVIRGAGSILYGSGAVSGVVNIITKMASDESSSIVFATTKGSNYFDAGAMLLTNIGGVNLAMDTYYQNHDDSIDTLDRHLYDYSFGIRVESKNFTFLSRIKKSDMGNVYGVLAVEDTEKNRYNNINETFFAQLSYSSALAKDGHIEALVGYMRYGQKVDSRHPSLGGVNTDYLENSYYTQIDYTSNIIEDNELLVGGRYEIAKVLVSQWNWNNQNPALPQNNVSPDATREVGSLYLNDKYTLNSQLDISAGLRYDNYSDFGSALSPTIGLVYKIASHWRVKGLYSKAFRAPSWVELDSNSDLEAEKSSSIESGVIYKNNKNTTVRLNAYVTTVNNLITKPSNTYIQNSYADFIGGEFEYIFLPNNSLELNLFGSYVKAKDSEGNDLSDIANELLTFTTLYQFNSGFSLNGLVKYVGSSKRAAGDGRNSLSSSITTDITLAYDIRTITAFLTITDIFDKGTSYALLPTSANGSDYIDAGRSVSAKLLWKF